MKCSLLGCAVLGTIVLALGSLPCLAQSTDDIVDDESADGGLDTSVTTPPTTTGTTPTTTDTTDTTGGTMVLTPRNSVANIPQFNGFKTRMKQFQFPSGANLVAAETATGVNPFRDAFLIPFIESIFEELQTFIVRIAAASALGNALPPTTSAPA